MKLVIELDKVAYDLLTGKIETANIDLFSTLIKSVQNGAPLSEELEKIKREIHDIKLELDCDYYTGDKITRLIDKHIAELKGEAE